MSWISENAAWIALFFMCFYICAYAWSWGPLPWLYAAEVQFLETRSAGQSIATLINLLFSFVIGQASAISAVQSISSHSCLRQVYALIPCSCATVLCAELHAVEDV